MYISKGDLLVLAQIARIKASGEGTPWTETGIEDDKVAKKLAADGLLVKIGADSEGTYWDVTQKGVLYMEAMVRMQQEEMTDNVSGPPPESEQGVGEPRQTSFKQLDKDGNIRQLGSQ